MRPLTIPEEIVQKQIGVVAELQELVSSAAKEERHEDTEYAAAALASATTGLAILSADHGPDFESLKEAVEGGVEAAFQALEANAVP